MKTILIVEDNPTTRKLYVDFLTPNDYQVEQATNGQEALARLKGKPPINLVMLDVMLPGGMNGLDILEEIKKDQNTKGIPVIMMTNLASEEKVARELGAADYLTKADIDFPVLLTKIKSILG